MAEAYQEGQVCGNIYLDTFLLLYFLKSSKEISTSGKILYKLSCNLG